jgi:pilus assembly protein CpaB
MRGRAVMLAVLVATVGGLLFWFYLKRFEAEASGGPRVAVLVSVRTMEPGAVIHDEDIGERYIPLAYVESRAIRAQDRQRITNLRISSPLEAQQTMMWTDIVTGSTDRTDLSLSVQPGMRAVTFKAEGKAAGLVRPGDRVDVLGTFAQPNSVDNRTTVVLLQNVLVLGRNDGVTDSRPTQGGSELALSLSLQHAQILTSAADKGKLSVALRSPDDVVLQEGLVDFSSALLVEAEKRAAAARAKQQGPTQMNSALR